MVKVFNWMLGDAPSQNINKASLLYGIGCMNADLMRLIDSMTELLIKCDVLQQKNAELTGVSINTVFDEEGFDKSPFGRQCSILFKSYHDGEINYNKMFEAVKKRNYFIHEFRINDITDVYKSAKDLYHLISLIRRINGSIEHESDKIISKIKKTNALIASSASKSLSTKHKVIKQIKSVINDNSDEDGDVDLCTLSKVIKERKINIESVVPYPKKFKKRLEFLGFEIVYDENEIAYARIPR